MRNNVSILTLLALLSLPGCRAGTPAGQASTPPAGQNSPVTQESRTVGYINGRAVSQSELYRVMAPQVGGEALAEVALDRMIDQRLSDRGVVLTDESIQAERQILLLGLSDDEDLAAQLLAEMRERRGLDDERFARLLRRNAGLRALVAGEVEVTDAATRLAHQQAYGPRYRVRLIVTETMDQARQARRQVIDNGGFSDAAVRYSIDPSRAQGGLLSPISPADPTYPKAIRDALPRLSMDDPTTRLSPILAIDSGFAIIGLEEVIPARDVAYESVEADLRRGVRLQLERVRMQQLARSMLEQANVVVLDPLLQPGWEQQGKAIRRGAQ